MKTQTIYLDTSVIGGCFDDEFRTWSNSLMGDIAGGLFHAATSQVVATEIASAPPEVRAKYEEFLSFGVDILEVTTPVETLTEAYLGHQILKERYRLDMLHIALATVHNVDILVSWNFKHIVHFDKIVKFNAVNMELGYRQLAIHSPREVTTHEED